MLKNIKRQTLIRAVIAAVAFGCVLSALLIFSSTTDHYTIADIDKIIKNNVRINEGNQLNGGPPHFRYPPLEAFQGGFRDLKWHDPPSMLGENRVRVGSYDVMSDTGMYEISGDVLTLGKAKLKKIEYWFNDQTLGHRGGFRQVLIYAADEANFQLLREWAFEVLGGEGDDREGFADPWWRVGPSAEFSPRWLPDEPFVFWISLQH
jgi:hypothetical protein